MNTNTMPKPAPRAEGALAGPTVEQMTERLDAILHLVESDQYASAFQSLSQYRVALKNFIHEVKCEI